jgi:hypothetical protein
LCSRADSVTQAGDDIALTGSSPPVPGVPDVQANLFPDDTLHKVFVNVFRAQALAGQYALDRQNPTLTLAAPNRPLWSVIVTYVREGIHHIFIGPDHILFVLALVLLGSRPWAQVKIITDFTVAPSITLALATLNTSCSCPPGWWKQRATYSPDGFSHRAVGPLSDDQSVRARARPRAPYFYGAFMQRFP